MNWKGLAEVWRGEEKLSVVFWLYYVSGLLGFALLGAAVYIVGIASGVETVAGFLAAAFVVSYLLWVWIGLWVCAFNVQWCGWGYLARGWVLWQALSVVSGLVGLVWESLA